MYFETRLGEYSGWKLSDLDWEILEGLETVLEVSHLVDPMGRPSLVDRFLADVNKACRPNPRQSCRV